jgi:hypothetical protein
MSREYRALMEIRELLRKPRDYSHPPSIATLLDDIESVATLACAQEWSKRK